MRDSMGDVSTTSTVTAPTLRPDTAYRAGAVAEAERRLTAATDRYMHHAAHALALAAVRELRATAGRMRGRGVLLLVGGGHNGGDALLAGALLARRGCDVTAAVATGRPHAAALEEARRAGVRSAASPPAACEHAAAGGADLVIDGLTGIGATGPLRPTAVELVAPLIAAGRRGARGFRVLAVDVPSGTGVDDGTVSGPVLRADLSVTFTCLKGAHLLAPAAGACGRVEVVDLGLPVPAASDALVRRPDDAGLGRLLRIPDDEDHKYTRGVVGLRSGSRSYPGAAVLAASAAVRCGVGMVRLSAPRRVEDLVLARRPEVVPASGRCQALVIGPGTDPADPECAAQIDAALGRALEVGRGRSGAPGAAPGPVPAVIDAGALPLLAERLRAGARCSAGHVLTPHAGEAAALLSALEGSVTRAEVEAAPAARARDLVRLTGATVLLKGSPALIASARCSDGPPVAADLLSVDSGPGWLATAGSGDVLAGILGAVLAAGRADEERGGRAVDSSAFTALAVRLHAVAAELASGCVGPAGRVPGRPLAALDLTDRLPHACAVVAGWAA